MKRVSNRVRAAWKAVTSIGFLDSRVLTASGSIGTVLFALGLIFPRDTTVYRPSVYADFHSVTWVGFLVALVSGMLLLYRGAANDRITWLRGLLIVLLSYLLLYAAPKASGHLMYGSTAADAVYHLGVVKTMIDTGTNIGKNWYPATHALISAIHLVSETPLSSVMVLISYLFTSLYIITAGLYARLLSNRVEVGMVTTFAVAPLLFSHFQRVIQPASLSFMLLPTFLFLSELYLRNPRRKRAFAAVGTFLFVIPFFHPLTVAFGGFILVVKYSYSLFEDPPRITNKGVGNLAVLLGVTGAAWYGYQERTGRLIWSVIASNFITSGSGTGTASSSSSGGILSTYTSALSQSGIDIWVLLREYVFGLFAPVLVYGLFGGVFATYFLHRFARSRGAERFGVYASLQTYIGAILVVTFLTLDLIVANPFRAGRYAFLFGAIVIGFGLTHLRGKPERRHQVASVAVVVLVIVSAVTASMFLYRDNNTLEETTVEGTAWYIKYENNHIVQTQGFSTKIEYYIQGWGVAVEDPPNFRPSDPKRQLPMHLGYDENTSICETRNSTRYLLIRSQDTEWFTAYDESRWNRYTYFTDTDVQKLAADPSVNRIYANNGFSGWLTTCK